MINSTLFFLFIAQGVIHLQGVFAATNTYQSEKWNVNSKFSDKYFRWANKRVLCFGLYLTATTLFFGAAFSYEALFIPLSMWFNLLVTAVAVSFIGLDLFPNAIAVYINRNLAIAFNVLIAILYLYISAGLPMYP